MSLKKLRELGKDLDYYTRVKGDRLELIDGDDLSLYVYPDGVDGYRVECDDNHVEKKFENYEDLESWLKKEL